MRIFRLDVLLLFAVLALFAGFAYLTQNPDSPWLEKAMEWPAVGGLAGRFRTAYLGPEPGEEMAAEPEEPEEEEPLRIFVDGSVRRPPATRPTPRAKSPAPERQSAPPPAERPLRHRLPRGPLPGLRRPRREPQAVPEADGHRRRGPGPLLPPLALGRASGGRTG